MKSILVTDRYTSEALALLNIKSHFHVKRSAQFYPTAEELKDVNALLIRSRSQIDRKLLAKAPQLQMIVTATSGVDHIDLEACAARHIVVENTPEANTHSAAELTLMLMLQSLRQQEISRKTMAAHRWKDELRRGFELRGKDLGIVGLGRVGSRVAQLAQAFGMKVFAADPYKEDQHFKKLQVERLGFTELLLQSHILSLHVPLTAETKHMINNKTLGLMNPNAFLINASRGAVINEGDLTHALEQGQIAGAGLDVFETEPLPKESRLRQLSQVILSPHLGAFTDEAYAEASHMAVQKVLNFFTR